MLRRHSKTGASFTSSRVKKNSNNCVPAGASVALPGEKIAGIGESVPSGGGSGSRSGGIGWEDAGSTNPTTPVIEGGSTQDAMLGRGPGSGPVSSELSPVLQQQQSEQQQVQELQQNKQQEKNLQQKKNPNFNGEGIRSRIGSRGGNTSGMTTSRRSSGVLLADVARRVSRSFSALGRGRSGTSDHHNDGGEGIDAKKSSSKTAGSPRRGVAAQGSGPNGKGADEVTVDNTKTTRRSGSNQTSGLQNGPTPDEATATHNTNGNGDAERSSTPLNARGSGSIRSRFAFLRSGEVRSKKSLAQGDRDKGAANGHISPDRVHSLAQGESTTGTRGVNQQQAVDAPPHESGHEGVAAEVIQGANDSSSNSSAAAGSSSSAQTQNEGVSGVGPARGGGQEDSRRESSVAAGGGGSNGERTAIGGGGGNNTQEPLGYAGSKKKFHIPHPHLPSHFRHRHHQELKRGASGGAGEAAKTAQRHQQHAHDGSSVGGEEGAGGTHGTRAAAASTTGAAAGNTGGPSGGQAGAASHHQSHHSLLHLGNFLHHHKGSPGTAGNEQGQAQQQTQHHLLPHLHLLHGGGGGSGETAAPPEPSEDSVELLAHLHSAHEKAREIIQKSRTQREHLLQRARDEVEKEAEAFRQEAALSFEKTQEQCEAQTEEQCRADAAACEEEETVHVDPAALTRASQLCVAETLKVRVHLPEEFRKRLCVIQQHPPTFFRKSCASQYPSTRGLRDPAVLKAALHHAYCYHSDNRSSSNAPSYMDDGASSAYRGAALDTLGGGLGATSVSDANREAYAAILGERGAWTEQDDEFRLDLREETPAAGGGGQCRSLLESILNWFLVSSSSGSPGDGSGSSSSSAAAGGRKEDERPRDRRAAPTTCNCWPLVPADPS